MRIHEILSESEGKPRKSVVYSSPGAISYPDLNPNNNPYLAYRFGVALAGSPDFEKDITPDATLGPEMVMTTYTDEDAKIVKAAGKKIGSKPKVIASKGSMETPSTQKTSPVAKIKRNKYGI